jgi:hypothetical protein
MSWSLKFDEPIAAPNHLKLRTLRDAGNYIAGLPDAIQQWPVWQTTAETLMLTAEGKRSVMFAQIAMLQALNYGRPVEAAMPRTKAAKKYRIVSWPSSGGLSNTPRKLRQRGKYKISGPLDR